MVLVAGVICNSRNFTMVYTINVGIDGVPDICNSRNFTMVYTSRTCSSKRLRSAIAEILLWFTPRHLTANEAY